MLYLYNATIHNHSQLQRPYFLEQCVFSVQKALEGIDSEIIVIDNASSDDSCEMMKTKFPQIKLIENKDNLGFPKGIT